MVVEHTRAHYEAVGREKGMREAVEKVSSCINQNCKGHTNCERCEQTKFLARTLVNALTNPPKG